MLLVGIGEVEGLIGVVEDAVIDNDERLSVTIDSGNTTQTHGCTSTEVTRVRHDIETGNLTLQCLVGTGKGHTLDTAHVESLLGY